MWIRHERLMAEGDEAGGGSAAGGAGAAAGGASAGAAGGVAGAAGAGAAGTKGDAGAGKGADDEGAGGAGAAGAGGGAAGTGTGKAEAKGGDTAGYWPEDWRQTVSAADEKILSRLQRYASPADVAKALIAAQNKISSGELKPVLGKDAKPEEVADYRKAMGIPETADKYEVKDLPDADKPLAQEIFKAAHASNQTTEQVSATMKAWGTIKAAALEAQATKDQDVQKTSEDSLRAEWGTEFRRNINLVHGMLDGSGTPELKDQLLGGRLSDGTPIGSSPAALKMLLGLALVGNPAGVVVPGGSHNTKGIDDRITEIEKMMRTDRKAYNDPKISGPDGEYSRLLTARENLKVREKA